MPGPRKEFAGAQLRRMEAMWQEGESELAIGLEFDVSSKTIARVAKRQGWPSRPRCKPGRHSGGSGANSRRKIVEGEAKTRDCLYCRRAFLSSWAGNRICRHCKDNSAFQGGAML